jgi:hypothetical protein
MADLCTDYRDMLWDLPRDQLVTLVHLDPLTAMKWNQHIYYYQDHPEWREHLVQLIQTSHFPLLLPTLKALYQTHHVMMEMDAKELEITDAQWEKALFYLQTRPKGIYGKYDIIAIQPATKEVLTTQFPMEWFTFQSQTWSLPSNPSEHHFTLHHVLLHADGVYE